MLGLMRPRRLKAVLAVTLSLAALPAGTAYADSPISLTPEQPREFAFKASVYGSVSGTHETEEIIYAGVAWELARAHPEYTAQQIRFSIHQMRQAVDARRESTPM